MATINLEIGDDGHFDVNMDPEVTPEDLFNAAIILIGGLTAEEERHNRFCIYGLLADCVEKEVEGIELNNSLNAMTEMGRE